MEKFTIEVTKEQLVKFEKLIDIELKLDGLKFLETCVELMNVLMLAKPVVKNEPCSVPSGPTQKDDFEDDEIPF